jgi:RimJ/RimL family protein N-acetyltransferase
MTATVEIPVEFSDGTIAIRTHQPSDVYPYFEATRESIAEVSHHLPWLHQEYAIEETRMWIEKSVPTLWEQQSEYHFAITDVRTGSILGGCGLDEVNWTHQTANLGYWVRTSRTRQGVATAASRLLVRFGFEQLQLKRIDVVTSVENVPSARVAENLNPSEKKHVKNSAYTEGTASDTIIFSLFPQDAP